MSQPPGDRPDARAGHLEDASLASDPPLDAATERRLRGLLADARVREPMPGHVAARLDDVLAELRAEDTSPADADESGAEPDSGNVRELRPRRRRAATLLVAAAAVVVIGGGGVAVSQAVRSSGDSSGARSFDTQSKSGAGSAPSLRTTPSPGSREPGAVAGGLPAIHSASFEHNVVAILNSQTYRDQVASGQATAPPGCSVAPSLVAGATSLGVLYDSRPAIMVVAPARGTHHRVTIISCESTQTVRSATVNTG